MIGGEDITHDDLIIHKLLGQNITKYRSLFPHVSAAIQLCNEDRPPSKGDTIKYIYTDSQRGDPLRRVVPVYNVLEHNGKANTRSGARNSVSKAALNALSRILAADLHGTGILVNSVDPSWVSTDMGGRGGRPVEDGAKGIVWAATLPRNGPSGGFYFDGAPAPW